MTAFAASQIVYTDLSGKWGEFRLFVGGKDVTNFRGKRAQIGGYQLTEPYAYGPADFMLPGLTQFEVDKWGVAGSGLRWMGNGKPVVLKRVVSSTVMRVVWRGFITNPEITSAGVALHCDGEASGRLALRSKLPELFALKSHVGRRIYDCFTHVHLNLTPYLGGDIGVLMDGRGMSGTYLDYANSLLAATIGTDGSQYTVHRGSGGGYHLGLKDTTTVDFTVFLGAHGVDASLSQDLSETPTTIYGQGVAPSGLVWVNGRYQNLQQGRPAPYPMDDGSSFGAGTTDADTDSGDGITVMIYRLLGAGLLDRRDRPGGYDDDVTDAVGALQDEAELTVTGNMNPKTWDALFDLDETGVNLRQAYVAPLAQLSKVRPWKRSSSGVRIARNPNFDPKVIEVDLAVDHGTSVEKSRARRYSKGVLHRAQTGKNWQGTITLSSDVFAGSFAHGGTPTQMSRLDVQEGMNVMLRNFDGDTLFHVAIVNVDADLNVTLGVDTKARDAATLGEVIARNIESRSHPARQWLQSRRTDANARFVEFSEVGGQIFDRIHCPGNQWTVFPVIAGEAGSVSRLRIETENDPASFAVAITAQKTSPKFWANSVGNPLAGSPLDDVALNKGGSGYTSAPAVNIAGGGGDGATATASVSGGQVVSLNMTSAGHGYQAPPHITFSGGGGSGAKASAYVTPVDKWSNPKLANMVDRDRALLGAWGSPDQPCGYQNKHLGGSYTNDNGDVSGDPVTGLFVTDSGFDYHTFGTPVLWVAIYPDRDTVIPPQRILWETMETLA